MGSRGDCDDGARRRLRRVASCVAGSAHVDADGLSRWHGHGDEGEELLAVQRLADDALDGGRVFVCVVYDYDEPPLVDGRPLERVPFSLYARVRRGAVEAELVPGETRRDVLIGKRGYIDRRNQIQIVDWRIAPVKWKSRKPRPSCSKPPRSCAHLRDCARASKADVFYEPGKAGLVSAFSLLAVLKSASGRMLMS